jgi:uncharacterized membrane protein HdeD (DUF308 family)
MATELDLVARPWWVLAVRGVAAVVFGLLALALPGITLYMLVLLFGAYALIDGVLAIGSAIRSGGRHLWYLLAEGVVGILAGIAAFAWPGLTAFVLLVIIAAWAIVTGLLEVISAVRLRNVIHHEWAWIISGVLSLLFGVLLLARPAEGALAVVWLIGLYAILFGLAMFGLAWEIRELDRHTRAGGAAPVHQPAAS